MQCRGSGAESGRRTLALGLCALALLSCTAQERRPRGVLLVSLDTLRADRLGLYGYDRGTSPFLDSLASQSVVFDRAISPAPWTLPAHATMLTSMYPSVLGLEAYPRAGRVPERAVALAEWLQGKGFRSHAETAGGFVSGELGFAQGFEIYEGGDRSFARVIDRGTAWLSTLAADERFFLFLHTYDIHGYDPSEEARAALVSAPESSELSQALGQARRTGVRGLAELLQNPVHQRLVAALGEDSREYLSQLYDAAIWDADRQLARLVEQLRELQLLEDTLLIVVSDHGEELFDHGRSGHGFTLFEENLRVPLLLRHASLAPVRVAAPVGLVDLAPTVVDVLGLAAPESWQGRSLLADEGRAPAVFSEAAHRPLRAIREGQMKLIRNRHTRHESLFDLEQDPGEKQDLAGRRDAREAKLAARLDEWERDVALRRIEASAQSTPPLSPELSRQLEALGYLDPERSSDR